MVDEYALVADSGGAGAHRGGLGIARQISATVDGTIYSVRSDSHTVGIPTGVFGGLDARRARLTRNPGCADEETMPSKVPRLDLKAGDAMRIETPGGAGYGSPARRPTEALAEDLKSGRVSRAAAERDYGRQKVDAALALLAGRASPRSS
jgi:N-methylhydantoinase B